MERGYHHRQHNRSDDRGRREDRNAPLQGHGYDRSQRALNLERLAKLIGTDGVAAALVLREEVVKGALAGREQLRPEQLEHINFHLADAGFPPNWLETKGGPLTPDMEAALRDMAAISTQKAPIRRINFKRLVDAFANRKELLADALEVLPATLNNIVEGTALFDEHRMGHLNPKLYKAGFPDGWLEQGNPELKEEWLQGLETLAADTYEEALSATDQVVKPEPLVITDKANTESSVRMGPQTTRVTTITANLTQPVKTQEEPQVATTSAKKAPTKAKAPAKAKAKAAETPAPAATGLSRGALSAGRGVGAALKQALGVKSSAKPAAAAPVEQPPAATPAPTETAAPVAQAAKPAVTKKPAVAKKPAPQPAAQATAEAPKAKTASESTDKISKEQSLIRAGNLEQLFTTARRGAKVCLWRDLMKKSLPYAGNVKSGAILLRDPLANEITTLLGLPEGWLDNATFPPATLFEWVTNPNIPLPTSREDALSGATKPVSVVKPAPVQAALPSIPTASAAKIRAVAAAGRAIPGAKAQKPGAQAAKPAAPAAPAAAPAPAPAATPPVAPQVQAAAPAPTPAAAPAIPVAGQAAFAWTPAANPQPVAAPGPLTQVLVDQLQKMAVAGTFTEQDALQLLYYMMNPR